MVGPAALALALLLASACAAALEDVAVWTDQDALALGGLKTIDGNLFIENDVSTLASLRSLETVTGNVTVALTFLESLEGLNALRDVGGDFTVHLNLGAMADLSGLDSLTTVGGTLMVTENSALQSLEGLASLAEVGGLRVSDNAALESLAGLEQLRRVGAGGLTVARSDALPALGAGLASLAQVDGPLTIRENAILRDLAGLEALQSVGGDLVVASNPGLASLAGLENLQEVGKSLEVTGNPKLASVAALAELQGAIEGNLKVAGNLALTSLAGLEAIESVRGWVDIADNDLLQSVLGLESLRAIGGYYDAEQDLVLGLEIYDNPVLSSLQGLENLQRVNGSLGIFYNGNLTSLNLSGLEDVNGDLSIGKFPQSFISESLLTFSRLAWPEVDSDQLTDECCLLCHLHRQ